MLQIASLNSGSNGNCYYIGNSEEAILVDAGISCRETEKRMSRLGLQMNKVKAVFISHEHSDHIRGIEVLTKKFRMPVYVNEATRASGRLMLAGSEVISFTTNEEITVGNLKIIPFHKRHDAADPYSFTVCGNGVNVGVYTDIGAPCEHLIRNFSSCHAAFLESNYDEEMLDTGGYPYHLKQRIRGGYGHLSNRQALELFVTHRSASLSHLLLSHLSQNNNCPVLVNDLFTRHAGSTNIIVASRYNESAVYEIHPGPVAELKPVRETKPAMQMLLF